MKRLKFWMLLAFVTCVFTDSRAQSKGDIMVAFYNVENLFDTLDDLTKKDEEFTPAGDKQWNSERYQNKLTNLAKVISSMNNGKGPDILGLCEIENSRVIKDLVNQPALKKLYYDYYTEISPDERGIAVAFLYKSDVLPAISASTFPVPLPDSVPPTRTVLLVETEINEKPFSFIVCHFPSRSEGREASEYKRVEAAKVVKNLTDSLLKENPADNIIIMGDFNDEPTDSSIHKVINACDAGNMDKSCQLVNLMYPLKTKGLGSYKYREEWNMLDQLIINRNLFMGSGLKYVDGSAGIYSEEWMKQTDPKYLGSPLRTFGGKKYLAGYSDHFPVYMYITLK